MWKIGTDIESKIDDLKEKCFNTKKFENSSSI